MKSLELKVPPPIVAILIGAAMWGLSYVPPVADVPTYIRIAAGLVTATPGAIFALAGSTRIRRANTTINPMRPENASLLVTTGIFALTRNPMYVGLLFVVVGWAVFLSALWALLLGPAGFVLYLTRFQIRPEERALSRLFGAQYSAYRSRVRRWL